MNTIKIRNEDGTTREIPYKPTPPNAQVRAVMDWLISKGRSPAEAAAELADIKEKRLRRMYQNLVITGDVVQ